MNIRAIKRRIYRRYRNRYQGLPNWLAVDDQIWLNAAPVGREFGSPDYERLEKLDNVTFEVFGNWALVREWLDKPHPSLDGMTPEDVARNTAGADKVMALLSDLKSKVQTRLGSVSDVKEMFGKATKTVSIAMMNEAIAQCGASAVSSFYPCLLSVTALEPYRLSTSWSTGEVLTVDISNVLIGPAFDQIQKPDVFATVHTNGFSIEWFDTELGLDNVYAWGKEQAGEVSHEMFNDWMYRMKLSPSAAARALGISPHMVNDYSTARSPIPKSVWQACLEATK